MEPNATIRIPPHIPAVLALGVVSQIGQVVLLRELLMVFHGNELSIGLILAAWLVWVGAGSRIGAALADRFIRPLLLLLLNAAAIMLILPATVLIIRRLRGFFDVVPGAYLSLWDIVLSCFLIMAPTCLLLGVQFVLLSRVWRESDRREDTSGAGKTYIGEAAGNVVGGIVFTFLMVQHLNSIQSAVLAGSLMLAAYLILMLTARRIYIGDQISVVRLKLVVLALLALTALAFPFLESVDDWAHRVQWSYLAPQHQLLETHRSKHGAIAIVRREDQYSFFQSGHLIYTTAGPEALSPGLEEQEAAIFAHFSMVQHKDPRRVLLIGGGLRGTLSEIAKHPVASIDYIELDEALTAAARPYVSQSTIEALADPRVRLIHTDGRLFVKTAGESYDLIIVDTPDPTTAVLNRYYTEEFFREARDLLNPDGVFVIGVSSTPDLRGTAIANRNTTIYHTLCSVFERVLPAGEWFMFYFASDAPEQVSVDAPTLQERYRARGIASDAFSPHHYQLLLQEPQLRRVNWIVRNHGRSGDAHLVGPEWGPLLPAPIAEQEQAEEHLPLVQRDYFINSDFKPIGYYYTLMYWEDLTRAGQAQTLRILLRVQPWLVLPLVVLPLLAILGLRITARHTQNRSDTNLAVHLAVFTTGLSTMALQIALLFSFQSIYGFVYEMVGLIVAVFMFGLGIGTLLTHRYVENKASMTTLAGVQLSIAILAALIALVLPEAAAVRSPTAMFLLFSVLTFVAGLLNGVDFPIAAACSMALNRQADSAAGTVYGVELFGACLGAAIASVLVAPILGIIACCLLASIANATSFLALLISSRS